MIMFVKHYLHMFQWIQTVYHSGFIEFLEKIMYLDFYDEPASTKELLSWSKNYEEQEKRAFLRVVYSKDAIRQWI